MPEKEETSAGDNAAETNDAPMDTTAGAETAAVGATDGAGDNADGSNAASTGGDGAGDNAGRGRGGRGGGRYGGRGGRGGRRHYGSGSRGGNRAVFHSTGDNSDPSKRVYVGNLSWSVTWKELKDHFKATGCEITRADILASPDGRSKGCGIVEFETAEGASRAVLTLNDTELMGRQIFVREDREDGSSGGYYTQQPGPGAGGASEEGGETQGEGSGETQNCRVYVGNLSWDVAWQDLKDHMRDAGDVVFAEVMTESEGRSKGCGIVEYATPEEAKEAINTMNDTELNGRMIFVREDRELGGGGGFKQGGFKQSGGYRGGSSASTSVYVGNLAYETSWQDLKDHMRKAGNVDQANMLTQEDGRSKGCGIVVYQSTRDAQRAIRELQNTELDGRPIFVREDREQGGGRGGNRGGGSHRGGGGGGSGCQLFVGNLSWDTNWPELKEYFLQCGDVVHADVAESPDGKKKGFGTVKFSNAEDAAAAIEQLNGVEFHGRELNVRLDNRAR